MNFKKRILINTILPILYQEILKNSKPQQLASFEMFFASIPPERNSKTKYLTHRFFGDNPKKQLLNKAMMEQGAYQIHNDYCQHYEASCRGCPFVQKWKKNIHLLQQLPPHLEAKNSVRKEKIALQNAPQLER